jgi:predicted methyltransferase
VTRAIRAAVDHAARPSADVQRDASSKPVEVLTFIGIEPGMRVLDMNAAGGYYAEILARAVGPAGRVIAHNHPGARDVVAAAQFELRYSGNRLPNVEQMFVRHDAIDLPPGSLDAVLMSMVYHDTYWFDDDVDWGPVHQAALLGKIYDFLAPGGVVGVIDHYAASGTDPSESAMATHRIDPAVVLKDFADVGLILDAQSDVLRNRADDYAVSVFDPAVQGRTDRFVLRFRR